MLHVVNGPEKEEGQKGLRTARVYENNIAVSDGDRPLERTVLLLLHSKFPPKANLAQKKSHSSGVERKGANVERDCPAYGWLELERRLGDALADHQRDGDIYQNPRLVLIKRRKHCLDHIHPRPAKGVWRSQLSMLPWCCQWLLTHL